MKKKATIIVIKSRKKVKKCVDFCVNSWYITYALAKKCLFIVNILRKIKKCVDINFYS